MTAILFCLAIALHDVDTLRCATGERVRLAGIGATELDGTCRPHQPCAPGDPREQRRGMAALMRAEIAREDASPNGHAWFARTVELTCRKVGTSYDRITAWCSNEDGQDLSCAAIHEGIAVRWRAYDRGGRLKGCGR